MRKIIVLAIAILTFFVLTGCSGSTNATKDMQKSNGQTTTEKQGGDVMMKETKLRLPLAITYYMQIWKTMQRRGH
jgi:PBP1b-binding outer membrane lipoprotein LpoB